MQKCAHLHRCFFAHLYKVSFPAKKVLFPYKEAIIGAKPIIYKFDRLRPDRSLLAPILGPRLCSSPWVSVKSPGLPVQTLKKCASIFPLYAKHVTTRGNPAVFIARIARRATILGFWLDYTLTKYFVNRRKYPYFMRDTRIEPASVR